MSKVEELREEIVKSREELKSVFDAPAEDGKYSNDQKEKIKGRGISNCRARHYSFKVSK